MEINGSDIQEIQNLIIKNRCIMPNAKAKLGIVLFKMENKMLLEPDETKFLEEIIRFINIEEINPVNVSKRVNL